MAQRPALEDFVQTMRRLAQEAADELGQEAARITAKAAKDGALTNSRIVFLYADALLRHWSYAADNAFAELRRWSRDTSLGKASLREALEAELRQLISIMRDRSRVGRSSRQFENRAMVQPAVDRLQQINDDLDFCLRQFDIGMDDATRTPVPSFHRRAISWAGGHLKEVAIALIVALILAGLGLS